MSALGMMIYDDGRKEGIKEGIRGAISCVSGLGVSRERAMEIIREQFSLSTEETAEYMELYWN